ncbi:PLDc N-terminal domain-containing protein [Desulfosporosinus sp. SB140]|uniref:PLDc N-terminal domain-containing protein n=1 Tax=Desulfosporosinus paludis TaxID=3115649 RepID=UPI00388E5D1F
MVWIFLLLILQVLLFGTVILLENRDPGKTVAWLFILSLFPLIGFILYILLGRKQRNRMFQHKHLPSNRLDQTVHQQQTTLNAERYSSPNDQTSDPKLVNLLLNSGYAPLNLHNQAEVLINGGEKFEALFQSLENATNHIHLSYYIFKGDEIGQDVVKILARKVSEGVEVRVLLDGIGSLSLSGKFMDTMRHAGIQAHWSFPVRFPFLSPKLNLRYHRKIVVVDGRTGYMGGLILGTNTYPVIQS